MTLTIILATGFTDGALPHMELGSFLTFLPEALAKITVLQVIAVIALYK